MVEIPALELDGQNWKIYRAKILEDAATLDVLDVLAGWRTEPDDEDSNDWEDWYSCDCSAKWLIYPILPPQLVTPIRTLQTTHEMFVFLARKFHDTDPIERVAEKKVKTCANDKVSNSQSGSTSSCATETYWTVEQAGIATESPKNPPTSGDGLGLYLEMYHQRRMTEVTWARMRWDECGRRVGYLRATDLLLRHLIFLLLILLQRVDA